MDYKTKHVKDLKLKSTASHQYFEVLYELKNVASFQTCS
jgi:hypothetical protein